MHKIYFPLASQNIADKVTKIVYKHFMYRLKGDHCVFYFDINEDILFQNQLDCKNVTKYLDAVYNYSLENNVFEQLCKLMSCEEQNNIQLGQIDCEITQACDYRENCC